MNNVLILNGHQFYDVFAKGELTSSILSHVEKSLTERGFNVQSTHIDKGYEIQAEVDKLAWADYIFFQYPVYWMGLPWISKKYFDEVFMAGRGVVYANDGRPKGSYGSGGLMQNKKYMLSLTYNCPESEFNNPEGFFDGLTLDQTHVAVHKIFQFCGMQQLPTFAVFDIFKGDLNLSEQLKKLDSIFNTSFKN